VRDQLSTDTFGPLARVDRALRAERALEAERRRAPEQHREPVSHAAAHALPDTRAA